MKRCSRCKTEKPEAEWMPSQWKGSKGGWCRQCFRDYHRITYDSGHTDEPRNCKQCGSSYQPKSRRPSWFCSRLCKDASRKERNIAEREASKPDRKCLWCSAAMPKNMRIDASYCSDTCNNAAHQAMRKLAKRAGVPKNERHKVLRTELQTRDGSDCHLCGYTLNLTTKHPDPRYASIDHVTPLALGGTNDLANLRLACLECNLKKGATLPEEVKLLSGS